MMKHFILIVSLTLFLFLFYFLSPIDPNHGCVTADPHSIRWWVRSGEQLLHTQVWYSGVFKYWLLLRNYIISTGWVGKRPNFQVRSVLICFVRIWQEIAVCQMHFCSQELFFFFPQPIFSGSFDRSHGDILQSLKTPSFLDSDNFSLI